MKDSTLCFLMSGDPPDQILLGYKKKGFCAGKSTGIGGKVEAGEIIENAATRELEEETGVMTTINDLQYLGHLTFLCPSKPAWSQVSPCFQSESMAGIPMESDEVTPVWVSVNQIPYEQMWQDAHHWLPFVLRGEPTRMRFVFGDDNETVQEVIQDVLQSDI